ncbi:transcriptional regulator, AlpA family [Devosia enhydra]|uniref:Transcriptional regulator, AlpA family n=1 Tax=Devosia enhydra TaxID=665118 RepID=A0A1K2HZG2_9HYPH|nr:transcriptional regulator, AlpA family [Devosia enhydra]
MNEIVFDRLIDEKECRKLTTLGRTTRYRLRDIGLFPEPVAISPGRRAYRLSEIQAWIAGKWVHRSNRGK